MTKFIILLVTVLTFAYIVGYTLCATVNLIITETQEHDL